MGDKVMTTSKNTHPVDEILPLNQLFLYGLQHVLAMYAGAVAVPLILANALGLGKEQLIYLINADLFTCGIATLIQTLGFWKMGIKIPVIQGVTFAAVTPMILIGKSHGLTGIYGSVMIAGIITYLASPYFSRLIRFFPPVVTGSIITIIGVSLLPVAVRWAGGGAPGMKNFGDPQFIALAFVVLAFLSLYCICSKCWSSWSNSGKKPLCCSCCRCYFGCVRSISKSCGDCCFDTYTSFRGCRYCHVWHGNG
ncbi:MAG: xanthine permease [Firmicutes bacterium]|nr:xanthine permease [Bacillota bacterium]